MTDGDKACIFMVALGFLIFGIGLIGRLWFGFSYETASNFSFLGLGCWGLTFVGIVFVALGGK